MRKTFGSICMAIALAFGIQVQADDVVAQPGAVVGEPIAACDVGDCYGIAGTCGGWVADIEATFFRYHRADGVQSQVTNPIEFDFEISPRVTLGYVGCDGLGARVRWWDYDHSASVNVTGDVATIAVDTFTVDAELFEVIQIGCLTSLEWSAGVRYVDFTETFAETAPVTFNRAYSFTAPGLLMGLQLNRCTKFGGEVYARARGSILMSDKTGFGAHQVTRTGGVGETAFLDVSQTISELGLGYQVSKCLCNGAVATFHAGVEMQHWANFSQIENSSRTVVAGGAPVTVPGSGPSDVGFGGFVIGAGLNY